MSRFGTENPVYQQINRVPATRVRVFSHPFEEVIPVSAPTHVPSIETHPDIVALRARYERASITPSGQAMEALAIVVGLYLAASPWIVGFNGFPTLAINNLITGIAYALLIGGFGPAFESSHARGWAASVIGLWTIIAPWCVFGSPAIAKSIASNVVAGVLALCLGLAVSSLTRRGAARSDEMLSPSGRWAGGQAVGSADAPPSARPDITEGRRGPDMGGGPAAPGPGPYPR